MQCVESRTVVYGDVWSGVCSEVYKVLQVRLVCHGVITDKCVVYVSVVYILITNSLTRHAGSSLRYTHKPLVTHSRPA